MFKHIASLLFVLILSGASQAQPVLYQEGQHYFRIPVAQPTNTPGKVEVVEVFSYGCGACARFQPLVDRWNQSRPANVAFSYMPADFNPGWPLLARMYYAAEALGLHDKSHQAIFDNNFVHNKPIRTPDEAVALLVTFGKSAEEIKKAMSSVGVEARLAQARKRTVAYAIDSTPTLVVNGKWRVNGDNLASHQEMIAVLNYLIGLETAAMAKTAAR